MYLTGIGSISTSTLGQNLSTLNDSLNISRILIFKEILDAITLSGSKNYAPVEIFAKAYTDVIKRILADHPDYITNHHIIDICQQALVVPPILEVIDHAQVKSEAPVLVKDKLAVTAPTVDELTQVNVDVPLLGGDEAELIGS